MKKILTIKLLIFSILTMSGCGPGSLKDTVVPVQMKCGQITEEIGITGRTEEERINGSRRTAGGINKTLVWRSRDK